MWATGPLLKVTMLSKIRYELARLFILKHHSFKGSTNCSLLFHCVGFRSDDFALSALTQVFFSSFFFFVAIANKPVQLSAYIMMINLPLAVIILSWVTIQLGLGKEYWHWFWETKLWTMNWTIISLWFLYSCCCSNSYFSENEEDFFQFFSTLGSIC